MGLLSALGLGSRALMSYQDAVRITGHNISNASTEGYTRQRVNFQTATPENLRVGIIGRGVNIASIERLADDFLNRSLRNGGSDLRSLDIKQTALSQAQSVFQELGDGDLSSAFDDFFDALDELSQHPEDTATRQNVVEKTRNLASTFRSIHTGLTDIRKNLDVEVVNTVGEVNSLTSQIADLNRRILESEVAASATGSSEPNDLRDQRDLALRRLGEIVEVKVVELSDGQVNVFAGGDPLVTQGVSNSLTTAVTSSGGLSVHTPIFSGNNGPVTLRSGRLEGLITSRDTTIQRYITDMNTLAGGVIRELNKVHAGGQGTTAFSTLTGIHAVSSATADLDAAGLDLTPVNGSFTVHVRNKVTGAVVSTNIPVDLDGIGSDSTLTSIASAINAISNVTASVGADNKLTVAADSSDYEFSFGNDTSHALAALGMNVMFQGEDASDIDVSDMLDGDPTKLASATSFAPGDNSNALALVGLRSSKVMSSGASTLEEYYQGSVGALAVETEQHLNDFSGQQFRMDLLENQRQEVSGVNIDEEMVKMIDYQRTYQASARFISVVDDMLNTLVNGLF